MRVFVDTDLWVYRLDWRQPGKTRFAADWLRELGQKHDIVISTQVLIELRSVLTRKLKPAFSAEDTRVALNALAVFEVAADGTGRTRTGRGRAVVMVRCADCGSRVTQPVLCALQ